MVRRTLLGASIQPCIKCPCPFSPFFFHNAVCCSWQKGSCHVFTQRQVKAVFKMNALCSCTTHQHQLVRGHSLLEIACRHAYCSAPQFIVPLSRSERAEILKRQPRPCTARAHRNRHALFLLKYRATTSPLTSTNRHENTCTTLISIYLPLLYFSCACPQTNKPRGLPCKLLVDRQTAVGGDVTAC